MASCFQRNICNNSKHAGYFNNLNDTLDVFHSLVANLQVTCSQLSWLSTALGCRIGGRPPAPAYSTSITRMLSSQSYCGLTVIRALAGYMTDVATVTVSGRSCLFPP